jgi:hypothetical protein
LSAQEPPQSAADSVPFLTVSKQVGPWQVAGVPEQTPLAQSVAKPQVEPVLQRWQVVAPPQSTALSLPFLTTSVQLGTWQMLPMQILLLQSLPAEQILPSAQTLPEATHGPPQSLSVSPPLVAPSVQVAAWHLAGEPEHTPLAQSVLTAQSLPVAQLFGHEPPQSASVSVPFLMPSVQVAAWHLPDVHTPLAQSLAPVHTKPVPQRLQVVLPPQSTSVSPPFLVTSVQLAV